MTKIEQRLWRALTPPEVGVYFLMLKKSVVYIGCSKNIRRRVLDHRQNGRVFDYVYAVETKEGEERDLERQLIAAVQPEQNRAGVPVNSWSGAFGDARARGWENAF
jgi:excinuclease UvrABC nuclease subunit